MTIWFASGNSHKKAELAAILNGSIAPGASSPAAYNLMTPAQAGLDFAPEETGATFSENALLKAQALYTLLQPSLFNGENLIIADDSGICVDALGGRPGVLSARYGNSPVPGAPQLTDEDRNALLLEEMDTIPVRTARFVCAMTLLLGSDRFVTVQETLEGEIVKSREWVKGSGGFGYDPLFFIPALGRTVAELSETEKNTISHRAKAAARIAAMLRTYS